MRYLYASTPHSYIWLSRSLYIHKSLGAQKCYNQGSRAWTSVLQSHLGTRHHWHQLPGWGFAAAWLAQGHRENLWWSKTKDVRLQQALLHSKGSLSHSDKALQLAGEPSDYVTHPKNTLCFHKLFTSLLSFSPACQHQKLFDIWAKMQ